MFDGTSRRSFLASGAAAGAAALAGGTANAQPRSDSSKYKIGVLGLDYTFWGLWANILQHDKGNGPADVLNIVPTHVWDKDPVKAREWADKWGWEVVDSYDGMVGKVDAVVNGELYNIPWQHKLMRPYLEANARYLSWIQELLEQCRHLDDISEKHWKKLEEILYNFDSGEGKTGRINMASIEEAFRKWLHRAIPNRR